MPDNLAQKTFERPHLSSELSIVQVLGGSKKLSALRNSEVLAFGNILRYCINRTSITTASSGHYWVVSVKGGSTVLKPARPSLTFVGAYGKAKNGSVKTT